MSDEPQEQELEAPLVPHRQLVVSFYGDNIPVAEVAADDIYVPLRPLVEFLGLAFSSQRQRVLRDRVMAARVRQVAITAADGKQYQTLCLPLDLLPGWLFGIDTSRVRADLVDKIERYRAEAFRVLWNAFKGEVLSSAGLPLATDLTPAEQILTQAEAIAALARQQVEFERGLADVAGRQQAMADYMRNFIYETRSRLTALELRLDPAAQITDEQAAEIALAVKNVGSALEAKGANAGYAKVYSEMYRRYRVSSYKNLPSARYEEVLRWLSNWYEQASGKLDNQDLNPS
ncbi:MAG: hypothetical protein DLM69_00145 [Candidatus Chloroheliales bacterium]|nr:MAG: hypothetical protein DLM69_00145 [Chloroflexota bacterium]